MKFALFYSDTEEFIAARDDRHRAIALARSMSGSSAREVTVLYNGPRGELDVCCKYRGTFVKVTGGYCLGPVRRWLFRAYRFFKPVA